jgi:hypothetical protein
MECNHANFARPPGAGHLLVLLALGLLTGVAYAIGRLSGFVPGFGFVSDAASALVLETPVETTESGIRIRVEKAVNDSSRFWVEMTLSQNPHPETLYDATVLLSNGQTIPLQQMGWHEPLSGKVPILFEFPPLPLATESITLQFKYSLTEKGSWTAVTIPVKLRPLRSGEIIPAQPTDSLPRQSETQEGVTLVLENVAPASDKTVLQVSLRFDQSQTWLNSDWSITLTDKNGSVYPLTNITPDVSDGKTKIYETLPFTGKETLTLSLTVFPDSQNLPISTDFSAADFGFTFEPGSNPQVGQTWQLDETIQVGKSKVQVVGAKLNTPTELVFEFAPVEKITGVMLYNEKATGAIGGIPVQAGNFTSGLTFKELPGGPINVKITRIDYTAHGNWQIHWQASSAPSGVVVGPTNTPVPTPSLRPTPSLASSNPILLKVQELAQKFDLPFQQGPGWVHVVSETITKNGQAGQTYPPPYLKTEQWYEIDSNGYVLRSVWLDKDANGQIIQQTASLGSYFINFTTGDTGFNENSKYQVSLDMLTRDLNQAAQYNTLITSETTQCEVVPVPARGEVVPVPARGEVVPVPARGEDGSACMLVTMLDTFTEPVQNPGETQSFYGSGRRTWINLQTGQQVKAQGFWRLQDGGERIDYTSQPILVEKVSAPPQEILDILAKVVVP